MSLRRSSLPAFGASLLAVLALAASLRLGPLPLIALLLAAGALALLVRPDWALGAAIALPLLVEPEPDWGPFSAPSRIYTLIPGTKIDPAEALLLLALAAALLARRAAREPLRGPGVMTAPLALLALALVAGAVTGHAAGAGYFTLVNASRNALPLLLVPIAVVQVVGTRVALRTALGALLAVAAVKGVAGIAALVSGQTAASTGNRPLTYYYSPANTVLMLALLFYAAAALRRLTLPRWAWAALPFVAACLLLSYRRSFWVASVLGLVLVVLFGVGREGRRLGIPAAVALGVALVLTLGSGFGSGLAPATAAPQASLGGRIASLNPTSVSESKDDRYRIGERRNVIAELRESPVAGLGLGVDYRARYPLSIGDIPRDYVHFAVLWWWMKCGILGAIGYLAMMITAVWAGVRIFRHHPDRLVRAAGLAAAAGMVGFAVAETTATFVGPDARSSILMGLLLGLLAVGHREAMAARLPAA